MLTVFFFNDTATTEIYTLSLHDALPIFPGSQSQTVRDEVHKNFARDARATMAAVIVPRRDATRGEIAEAIGRVDRAAGDRKSTRLNSSHANISYAVFCLKKKKTLAPLIT